MTLFANTIVPAPVPTKEEIFGESLDYISQIPAMVTAFNANSQTSATSISYMWILLLAVVLLSVLTYLNSIVRGRRFDSKMRDLDDSVANVNTMTLSMDNLVRSISEPLQEVKNEITGIKSALAKLLKVPQIKENLPVEEKKDKGFMKIKKIIPSRKKDKPKTESDEVLEALQPTPEEIQEEREQMKKEPEGGFIQIESDEETEPEVVKEEKVPPAPPPKEENPIKERPDNFVKILESIDFDGKVFREGELEKWTYNELNTAYSWIVKYRKWSQANNIDIPEKNKRQQDIAEKVIYYAIFAIMEKKMKNGK